MRIKKTLFVLTLLLMGAVQQALAMDPIIPKNTATHTAVTSGKWSNKETWGGKSIPGYGAIVYIPNGISVDYNMNSSAHIFAIRNDGILFMRSFNNQARKLVVDTFINTSRSFLNIRAHRSGSSNIDIIIKPFYIWGMKSGTAESPNPWNNEAKKYYSDNKPVFDHFGKKLPNDGPGVLGRYEWDPSQISLGIMTMGKVRIIGLDKSDYAMTNSNVGKGSTTISLNDNIQRWNVNDRIFLTGTETIKQTEEFVIRAINGNKITLDKKTRFDHKGIARENLFSYVGNVTRNITIRSFHTDVEQDHTRRGHTMFMFNGDIEIKNSAFYDLGRTHKNNFIDDLKFGIEIRGTGNQQDVTFTGLNGDKALPKDVENQRGRYSLHFHKSLRGLNKDKLIIASGNAVMGSPGWGMVHHDSHADFTSNVIYKVEGGGMIAESGSETGIWKSNLVAGVFPDKTKVIKVFIDNGATLFPNPARRRARRELDDDFRAGSAYGMQGRAVRMVDNIGASSKRGFNYQGTGENLQGVADRLDVSIFEKEGTVNPFLLNKTIQRNAAQLIEFRGNVSASCDVGFKSQNRFDYQYHRVLSVIDDFKAWNTRNFGIYISSNFGYLFKNSYIHGKSGSDIGVLTFGIDNFNFSNTVFDGFKEKTISIRDGDGKPSGLHAKAEIVFHNVKWINSKSRPYSDFDIGKAIIKNDNNTIIRDNIEFTPDNGMDTTLDISKDDFKITVSGDVFDSAGKNDFVGYAKKRRPVTKRVYDFKNEEGIKKFLEIKKDGNGRDYAILTEHISDRITGKITSVTFRINIKGLSNNKELDDTADISEITVYPNPVSNILKVSYDGSFNLCIYDINGRKIKNVLCNDNKIKEIDVSDLSNGLYFIKGFNNKNINFMVKH